MITEDEAVRLIDGCRMPHLRLFVIIALCTASRRGTILELKWSQVDFQRGVIDFNRQEQRSILNSGFSKGRAVAPMSALLRVALEEAEAGARTPFVIEWNGSRVADVKTGFIASVRRPGLQGRRISPHVLRHASASCSQTTISTCARFSGCLAINPSARPSVSMPTKAPRAT